MDVVDVIPDLAVETVETLGEWMVFKGKKTGKIPWKSQIYHDLSMKIMGKSGWFPGNFGNLMEHLILIISK